MTAPALYLRPNVVMEPLVSRWYAWLHLVSPATAPLFVAHQHLKILRSFVAQPDLHVAAMQNPELIGGPYLNYGPDRVRDIEALIEETTRARAHLLELAAAIRRVDVLLEEHPAGMSLEALYPQIPQPLRGFVELGYDLKNQRSFRPIEALLYRSPGYDVQAQELLLWQMDDDTRSFIFSTPRLEEPNNLRFRRPFHHPDLDALARLRHQPQPLDQIEALLGAPPEKRDLLRSLLTEQAPPEPPRYPGDGMRVRYFGHACVLLESRHATVLTDPVVSYRYPTDLPRFTFDDLPERIDFVLLTHAHADHVMLETLLPLRARIGTVVVPRSNGTLQDPSLRLALRQLGFASVVELGEMESIELQGGCITGIPFLGEHGDLHIGSKLAYAVTMAGRTVVAAADSNALEPALYRMVKEALGPIDLLCLGMESEGAPMSWVYGPLLLAPLARKMDQSRRLCGANADRAMAILGPLQPEEVWIYAMGQEPWLRHVMGLQYHERSPQILESNELLERCRALGIRAERPFCKAERELPPRA
jgi:L-ascorbate metabolism protein UlaG (beta-lactamase superfamily)